MPGIQLEPDESLGVSNVVFDCVTGKFWRVASLECDADHPRAASKVLVSVLPDVGRFALNGSHLRFGLINRQRGGWRLVQGYKDNMLQSRWWRLGIRDPGAFTAMTQVVNAISERLVVRAEHREIFDVVGLPLPRRLLIAENPFINHLRKSERLAWYALSPTPDQEAVIRLLADAVIETEALRQVEREIDRQLFAWNHKGW